MNYLIETHLHTSLVSSCGRLLPEELPVLVYLDGKGFEKLLEDRVDVLRMKCPLILVPESEEELDVLLEEKEYPCDLAEYPFSRRSFDRFREACVPARLWENRTMVFGGLRINRGSREVSLNGKKLDIRGYDYEILVILAEHMGSVVSREFIDQVLPRRKRGSLRNVDTHIKSLRKRLGEEELIQCVRSVGYCISLP